MVAASPPAPVDCCIAGGGPAGMMLALLLARAGVRVALFEKHADFLRDFRGDTIHPSTLDILGELGLREAFLRLPHRRVTGASIVFGERDLKIADLSRLPLTSPFIALIPQWDFLDFLAGEAKRYPHFSLHLSTEVKGCIEKEGRIVGIEAESAGRTLRYECDLVIAADGRHSHLRALAGFRPTAFGAPMDVLWFRLARHPQDPEGLMARVNGGRLLVMIDRGDYWQCAAIIAKGSAEAVMARGLDCFRAEIAQSAPFIAERTAAIPNWDAVKLLSVAIDRLERWWRPGLLFIGDAAHAMSPLGGVGINLAIQDAVAAANTLARPLREKRLGSDHLAAIERRRAWPTRMTQRLQLFLQRAMIAPALAGAIDRRPPWPLLLIDRCPVLQGMTARLIGIGFRPEHVAAEIRLAKAAA